jgi:hypothetical protein
MDTVKADSAKRVRIPDAKPGQVFAYERTGEGVFTLTAVKKTDVKARPYDPHLYDDLSDKQIELENAMSKVDVAGEERSRE